MIGEGEGLGERAAIGGGAGRVGRIETAAGTGGTEAAAESEEGEASATGAATAAALLDEGTLPRLANSKAVDNTTLLNNKTN
jgi:hypothetical protein